MSNQNIPLPYRNLSFNQLYYKLEYAIRGRKYAWAKYYEMVSQAHNQDYNNYTVLQTTVKEDSIPTHIKSQLTEMATALKKKWECPICFEFIPDGEVEITNCGHFYCKECLKNLKKASKDNNESKWSCAVCRCKHSHTNDE